MAKNVEEVIIVGSGPAGLTAAIYAARGDLSPLVIAGFEYGGQLMNTTLVENFPGFPEGIMGPKLMDNMIKQAEKFGARIIKKDAVQFQLDKKTKVVSTSNDRLLSKTVILSLGSTPKKLHIPGEKKFWGKGVSTCATCDAAFYREKTAAVVGGGDSAMEEANFISKFAKKVYVIHRRDEFRASKAMQEKTFKNKKIVILWNTEVEEINGEDTVNKLILINNKEKKKTSLEVDGMFLAIGHIPNTRILKNQIKLDTQGYIKVEDKTKTSQEGVFVAGDVKDYTYRQAITAAGMGCKAALDCERYLSQT